MGTNPNNLVGTNGAYGGRTSVNAFNDVLSAFTTAGVVSGWNCAPQSGMTIQLGGDSLSRDVAIAEDPFGNRTTINNREGEPVPVAISAASATTQRIDCVVAYVNSPATVQSTTLDNPEAVGLIDVKGSASSEPDDEAIRAAITADGGTGSTAYYVILATITVPAGATSITAGEIAQGAATMTEILANSVKSNNIDWATIERALVYSTTDTTLPANTQVKIPLNSLQGMSSGFSLNDGELVVEHDGVYLVQAFVMLVNAPGYTGIRILVNGSERLTRFYTSSGVGMLGTQTILLSLQANQKLRLTVNSANASRTGAYNNRTGITINRVG